MKGDKITQGIDCYGYGPENLWNLKIICSKCQTFKKRIQHLSVIFMLFLKSSTLIKYITNLSNVQTSQNNETEML